MDDSTDTIAAVQTPDRPTSIAESARDIYEEELLGREAIRLAGADRARATGLVLVEDHTLSPHCPSTNHTRNHAHHLIVFGEESVYLKEEAKTLQRFSAFCKKCGGEDTWAVVVPSWAPQSLRRMESLEALRYDLDHAEEQARALADEENGSE